MLTGIQIRAARSALYWSAELLAEKAHLASKTVRRLESEAGVPQTTTGTLAKIQAALEAAGIEFIGTPDDGPGIRIRSTPNGV
ncbi:MAG: XRE family transcriptional regulator [Burkholderiaceae bacterium]|nr:XRE family transcriptional regulator [Burkholderiaceae bacterium]